MLCTIHWTPHPVAALLTTKHLDFRRFWRSHPFASLPKPAAAALSPALIYLQHQVALATDEHPLDFVASTEILSTFRNLHAHSHVPSGRYLHATGTSLSHDNHRWQSPHRAARRVADGGIEADSAWCCNDGERRPERHSYKSRQRFRWSYQWEHQLYFHTLCFPAQVGRWTCRCWRRGWNDGERGSSTRHHE
jgi:hypothetical protein